MPQETTQIASIDEIFASQQAHRWVAKASSAAERSDKLRRLRDTVLKYAEAADAALHKDLRKMRMGASHYEVTSVISDIDLAIANLDAWMQPTEVTPSPYFTGNRTYIQYEARGVCLLFGPWNFPLGLVFSPLVPIIAAGNTAIVKPNELQPATSKVIAAIIRETFSPHEVAVVEGGIDVADTLLELPFDHIFFTGSPAVGKHIMAKAAKHLTSVTLELGGKCPAILDANVDLADVAKKIVQSRYFNAGQICLATDHVWVPEANRAELIEHIKAVIQGNFYANGSLEKTLFSRMVNRRNFDRVANYIEDARKRGATVTGGELEPDDLTIHPAILSDLPLDSEVMRHEIFGPLLPVLGYENLSEVLSFVEQSGKPLAMYVFSPDSGFIENVLGGSSSGGVTINDVTLHAAESNLPFGGVNQSGIGAYKGIYGFRELSHARSVFVKQQG